MCNIALTAICLRLLYTASTLYCLPFHKYVKHMQEQGQKGEHGFNASCVYALEAQDPFVNICLADPLRVVIAIVLKGVAFHYIMMWGPFILPCPAYYLDKDLRK